MQGLRAVTAGALLIAASSVYVACVADDPSTDASGDAGNGSDAATNGDSPGTTNDSGLAADAAPSLGCPFACLPPAPAGWTGPSAVYDGPPSGKPSACPATYTQKEVETFQGVDAGAAVCGCGAPTPTGSCKSTVASYSDPSCVNDGIVELPFTSTAAGTTCAAMHPLTGNTHLKALPATLTQGTCLYGSPTTTLPDAGFAAQEVSCGLPQTGACPNSAVCVATPVPDAPFTRLCIHKDGDTPCPSADYSQRVVANQNITDSRACSACVGTASGGTCGTAFGVTADVPTCEMMVLAVTVGDCVAANPGEGYGGDISPTGITCAKDGGAPQGTAVPANPVTFCCNK